MATYCGFQIETWIGDQIDNKTWRLKTKSMPHKTTKIAYLAELEIDEVLGLVRHVWAKITAHDGVPRGVVLFVEFLLDEGGDVLLDVVLFEGLGSAVDGVLPVTKISKLQCNEHRTSWRNLCKTVVKQNEKWNRAEIHSKFVLHVLRHVGVLDDGLAVCHDFIGKCI